MINTVQCNKVPFKHDHGPLVFSFFFLEKIKITRHQRGIWLKTLHLPKKTPPFVTSMKINVRNINNDKNADGC